MGADVDVAVVGAGVAGLATARALRAAGRSVHVFEDRDDVGGRMATARAGGAVLDLGAEMLSDTGYSATWRLLRDLGLGADDAPPIGRDIAVWRGGAVHPHLGERRGRGLSVLGRGVAAALLRRDRDVEAPDADDRALAEVGTREVRDYLLQPLAGGFFGWDVGEACAAPMLAHLRAVGSPSRYRTYRGGMDTVVRRLAAGLDVSTGVPVRAVTTTRTGARVVTDAATLTARQVVLAVPAPQAAALHPDAPDYVHACEFRPMVKVVCVLGEPLRFPTESFALAVPAVEDPTVAGVSLDHLRCPDRAPEGTGVVTLVASEAARWLDADDACVVKALTLAGERYLPGLRAALRTAVVARWRHGLPMPTPAALALRPAFAGRPLSAVDYAGDWYFARPCSEAAVRSAEVVAARVLDRAGALSGSPS
ncbi:FAD-dependent oxidoreductase [Actinokineospora bangkokensis]|uniref:Amine oxidase domain-containing protein n=1 Tax=Actinokineospora bangkokensis TaxID=1193682 RepID=A0A1Q9LGX5_9PSEU|nr:FAD-dependent oxidoreductase [Actinokineospora bangkokensis]OLR91298.1 hypothetical protein BJP25_26905 [Actinokineospora bangkokensis]